MKYFLFFLCGFVLLSCSDRKVPKGIIPPEQMETIMWQMMQVDEFSTDVAMRDSTKNLHTERIKRYRQVFQLNGTTKEAFAKSYDYYMGHPDLTKTMFDSLSARAARKVDTGIDSKIHPSPNSINKLNFRPPAGTPVPTPAK